MALTNFKKCLLLLACLAAAGRGAGGTDADILAARDAAQRGNVKALETLRARTAGAPAGVLSRLLAPRGHPRQGAARGRPRLPRQVRRRAAGGPAAPRMAAQPRRLPAVGPLPAGVSRAGGGGHGARLLFAPGAARARRRGSAARGPRALARRARGARRLPAALRGGRPRTPHRLAGGLGAHPQAPRRRPREGRPPRQCLPRDQGADEREGPRARQRRPGPLPRRREVAHPDARDA